MAAALLVVVGQPVFTDDLWWHLALGRAYAREGLWLTEDPLLFTAPAPPTPAAWLSDLWLYTTQQFFGFGGLRVLHVLSVAAICALVWRLIARTSRSALAASLGSMLVIGVATYRLVQLRPHLATIAAALLLALLLTDAQREMSRRRAAAVVALFVAWVNLHAGFVLGLAMGGAVAAGWLLLDVARWGRLAPRALSPRTRNLLGVCGLATLATLLNPGGYEPHIAYFIAGAETPSLARVGDEWSRVALFSLPAAVDLPHWLGTWLALTATFAGGFSMVRRGNFTANAVALAALSLLACGFALMAVRFAWLCVFPVAFASLYLPAEGSSLSRHRGTWTAFASVLLLAGYLQWGSWPVFARGVGDDYALAYRPARYQAHAVWWIADAGLRGPLFAEYSQSGFISNWLAPGIKTFINGSLNVRPSAIDANLPIRERRGGRKNESYAALLDREGVEIFLGIRLPRVKPTPRPWFQTTTHLEGVEGWVLVFRNLDSAVYLRDQPSNDENFGRVEAYYAEVGIPFERARGFRVQAAIEHASEWAIQRGVIPPYFEQLRARVGTGTREQAFGSRALLAELLATLGQYEQAIELDRTSLRARPEDPGVQRRIIWSLLRERRIDEAGRRANAFASQAPMDELSRRIIAVARKAAAGELSGAALDRQVATLPVLTHAEAARLVRSVQPPEIRQP